MPKYKIGCSGFLYDSWRGTFYPENMPQKKWLSFYVEKLNTVELNVTFYRLLKKEAFEKWYGETPNRFSFSLKGSRFITHLKKLKDVELPLLTFFNTTAPLMEKLEVVLWQLPPNFRSNLKILEDFVEAIKPYNVRHVFEFRHQSWLNRKVFKILSASNIAVCMADWPKFIDDLPLTADFVYIRRHGEVGSYSTNYTLEQLKNDAKRIKAFLKLGKDVYIYFNNDAMGYAPKNAAELNAILEKSLPKALLFEEGTQAKKPAVRKTKPAKKLKPGKSRPAKKVVRKVKKKKAVKKSKKKTVKSRKVSKKSFKKSVKKKIARKRVKKAVKKTIKKKSVKKTIKKKTARKPLKTISKVKKKKPAKKSRVTKKKRR